MRASDSDHKKPTKKSGTEEKQREEMNNMIQLGKQTTPPRCEKSTFAPLVQNNGLKHQT